MPPAIVNEKIVNRQFLLTLHYDLSMPPAHLESLPGQEPLPSSGRWFWPLVAGLLAAMGFLQISSIRQESQTWDEAVELAGGYRYLKTGEYRFFIEHPPLGKILVALPLLLLDPVLPADDPVPGDFRHVQYGSAFLYRNKVPAETMLFAARLVTISVTLSLGLVLALWTRRAFGPGAAVFALLLYSFDPNILAQGRYTKSGLLLTLLGFLAVVLWGRYLERPRGATLAATGVVFGLALATKFSAVFLVPVFAGLHIVQWWRRGRPGPVRGLIRPHLVVATLGVVVLLAMYAPEAGALRPTIWRAQPSEAGPSLRSMTDQSTFTGRAIAWTGARLGLRAHTLFVGLAQFAAYNRRGHPAYLMGRYSDRGWWYYFPLAFAFKTPVGTLAAIALGAGLALAGLAQRGIGAKQRRQASLAVWAMALPILVYLPLCLLSTVDTGLRHVLPVYPFLFALTGAAIVNRSYPGRTAVLSVMGSLVIAETLSVYPHFTAFFNRLVGGPANGANYLVDSNLDWGQDLKKLKTYMDQHGIQKVCLSYFGTADPRYHGIVSEALSDPQGVAGECVMAVSATLLQGLYGPRESFAWLRQQPPSARVGYSIYVYDLRHKPAPPKPG